MDTPTNSGGDEYIDIPKYNPHVVMKLGMEFASDEEAYTYYNEYARAIGFTTMNKKKDISFLTNLRGASERLKVFNADLDNPESFIPSIEGCVGVFHVAHPIDFEGTEDEALKIKRAINGTYGILRACIDSKTVRRVVYTSSAATIAFQAEEKETIDENSWSDVDFIRENNLHGASYYISKTLTERAALDFANENGLDLVTVIPTYINGPFICPQCPSSIRASLAMIFSDLEKYGLIVSTPFVHIDDVVSAHILLFEYPNAEGRYICNTLRISIDKLFEFLSARYPEYKIPPPPEFLKENKGITYSTLSSKKLLETGFKFKYGLEEMFDGAIESCKQKGFL